MREKILATFMMVFLLISPAWSCTYKVLESQSDTLNSKLISRIPVSKDMIKETLHFVYNVDKVEEQYKQPAQFDAKYTEVQTATDPYFSEFFNNCRDLYNASDSDFKTKVSVHLLLERVSEKYSKMLKLISRQKKLLDDERKGAITTTQADADRIFREFFAVDNVS